MARLARGNPHRPILTQSFVRTSSSVSVTVPPLINSQAVPVSRQARDTAPQRILSQPFINAPASSPIAIPPLIRSRATTNAALAYFRQGNQIVQSSLHGMPGGGGGSGGGGGTSSEQYTGNTREEAMIKAMMAVCLPCCHGSGSGGGSGSGSEVAPCCGCTQTRPWPVFLTVTIDTDCMGTYTCTLDRSLPTAKINPCTLCLGLDGTNPNINAIGYLGQFPSNGSAGGLATDCSTGILEIIDTGDELTNCYLYCYQCGQICNPPNAPTNPTVHNWVFGFEIVQKPGGIIRRLVGSVVVPIASCSPLVFGEISGTAVCYDEAPASDPCSPVSFVGSRYTNAIGCNITVNISE